MGPLPLVRWWGVAVPVGRSRVRAFLSLLIRVGLLGIRGRDFPSSVTKQALDSAGRGFAVPIQEGVEVFGASLDLIKIKGMLMPARDVMEPLLMGTPIRLSLHDVLAPLAVLTSTGRRIDACLARTNGGLTDAFGNLLTVKGQQASLS